MTTITMETLENTQENTNNFNAESIKTLVFQLGRFVVDRLTLHGDHQMGQYTSTPVFEEEHKFIRSNIVLGED